MQISRRNFLVAGSAALGARALPQIAARTGGRRILTVVYDKSLGMMRAIERAVP